MITKFALEGIDGSGKTTVTEIVANLLRMDGLHVATFAPYRLANAALGEDIYPMWKQLKSAKAAIGILRQVVGDCDEQAIDEKADITIFDRLWMTAMSESYDKPELVREIAPLMAPAAWLRVNPETARARETNDINAEWGEIDSLQRYAARYQQVADANFEHMLGIYRSDNDVLPLTIARSIQSDLYYRR